MDDDDGVRRVCVQIWVAGDGILVQAVIGGHGVILAGAERGNVASSARSTGEISPSSLWAGTSPAVTVRNGAGLRRLKPKNPEACGGGGYEGGFLEALRAGGVETSAVLPTTRKYKRSCRG